ncbi:MAG: tetratricopeptide repeat protein [Kofleriaceae bacterium]
MSQSDFVSRGQALVAAGQFQEAVKVCRLGLLGRPTTVEGRVVLGSALLALKRYDEVLAEMRVALELDHTAVPAHTLKAEALLKKGDLAAAAEALATAQQLAPSDPRVLQLLGETQNKPSVRPSAAHFVGAGDTKHYPNHQSGDGSDPDASDNFTKPTSLSSPGAPMRTSTQRAAEHHDPTPSPQVLSVGDKSGTMEVDPNLDVVQLDDDLDFDDLAAPPAATPVPNSNRGAALKKPAAAKSVPAPAAAKASSVPKPAQVPRPTRMGAAQAPPKMATMDKRTPTMDLAIDDDSDILEVDETSSRVSKVELRKVGGTAVRNAVQMPSGPIDISTNDHAKAYPAPPPQPLPPAPQPPRGPLAAALPTVAAMHPPQAPQVSGLAPHAAFAQTVVPPSLGGHLPSLDPAHRQTMIASAQPPYPQQVAQQHHQMPAHIFPPPQPPGPQPNWGAPAPDPRSLAAANEPTAQPMDPGLQAMLAGMPVEHASSQSMDPGSMISGVNPKSGIRKARSKLQIALWIFVGIVVIGGGVFAGFQIRAMRLKKQVTAARANAMELTKNDTYANWTSARDELSRIVHASGTSENQAALARARALIAFEFDVGLDDATVTVNALTDKSSVDANLAAAYLALAQSDLKAARAAADAALSEVPNDPAANYVASQVALLADDLPEAIKRGKAAVDKDARALYSVGLARSYAAATLWSEANATLSRAFAVMADQPSAVIERAIVLADSGQALSDPKVTGDVRAQLTKLLGDPKTSGVSTAQLAFGNLALAKLDFARNDPNGARAAVAAAGKLELVDQRFDEEGLETLFETDQLSAAREFSKTAIQAYPKSARLQVVVARLALAQGNGSAALTALKSFADVDKYPAALAVRGEAKLATGDIEGARADFEKAQKMAPKLEAALVGRAWVELAANDPDSAKKQLGDLASDRTTGSAPVVTVNAAILRRDPATRDKAKAMLESVVNGAGGPDVARAQLELARVYRDIGDFTAAGKAYAAAITSGNYDARLESGLLSIENRDPNGGRETLDALLEEAGDHASAQLVLETARARMLAGDHTGAADLLAKAENLPNVQKWQLQRERGRLHLRRNDTKAALTELGSALEGCGSDAETFLLAADAATSEEKSGLADKIKTLLPVRLKGVAEAQIVNGKLLLASGKIPEAEAAYKAARDQLKSEKAAPRRIAQTNYGLGVIAYQKEKDAEALEDFGLVLTDDPSIYDGYLFKADIVKDKTQAFEAAKTAVKYNADYPRAWHVLGKAAAKNNDKATLATAIEKLEVLAPGSPELKELEALKK